ncbi:HNH endonuclease [candidate division KSB1 bacterium]
MNAIQNQESFDTEVRAAAFQWLREQSPVHDDVLPRGLLQEGFVFRNERIPLVSPQGIFTPKVLDIPLSITTEPESAFSDSLSSDEFLLYRYRGTDPDHPDNAGLRTAMQKKIPLIYFYGIVPGKYLAVWPVYIVGDDPENLTFTVDVDISYLHAMNGTAYGFDRVEEDTSGIRRAYVIAAVKVRLHQRSFREKVLHAYRSQCALCRLRHLELLDAAHIIPDCEPDSRQTVDNGIALCKLHHAAFDRFIIGITPDYTIDVRQDILDEEDGPMLRHGLQKLHRSRILLPHSQDDRPDRELLDKRYERFKRAI